MNALELKIPPPVVMLLSAAAMWAIATQTPIVTMPGTVKISLSVVLLCLAGAFDLAGLIAFRRAKTTINPLNPNKSSTLVADGVYRITRNPMYVGMVFVQLAWGAYLACPWALVMPTLFVAYIQRFQIAPEERALNRLFGADYATYRVRVRRWL